MTEPLHYEIRNENIAKDLMGQGFTIYNYSPGIWTMEAPTDISSTKARKIISICIQLYEASKILSKAHRKYQSLVNEINRINQSR